MQIGNNKALFQVGSSFQTIREMQQIFDKLQVQLGTGKKAATLSEMGNTRSFSFTLRERLTRLDAYSSTINTVGLRLDMFDNVLSRLDQIEADSRSAVASGGAGSDGMNMASASGQARTRLDEVLTLLNTDLTGRYLFGGNVTDKKPVATTDVLLNGDGTRDGFKTVAAQRQMADMGDDNLGRLDIDTVSTPETLILSEDGAHPFGLKLATVSTSSAAFAVTAPTGTPPDTLSVNATGAPAVGDTLSFGVLLPDGSLEQIELTATDGTPGAGEFAIGATPQDTIDNVKSVLQARVEDVVTTRLRTVSLYQAADNFFNGQGENVVRVDGPDYYNATTQSAASAADTVFWYAGQDAPGNARDTVSARVDDSTTVRYGVQANESGPAELVRSLAVLSVDDFSQSDATSTKRFNLTAGIQMQRLSDLNNASSGSIEGITLDLSLARSSIGSASERHKAYGAQLDGMLTDIEGVSTEDVAAQLLQLQTRLSASYQTMSIVSGLSLVNYIK